MLASPNLTLLFITPDLTLLFISINDSVHPASLAPHRLMMHPPCVWVHVQVCVWRVQVSECVCVCVWRVQVSVRVCVRPVSMIIML